MSNHNYIDYAKAKKALFKFMDYYNLNRKPNAPKLSKTHYNTAEMMLYLYACQSKKIGFSFNNEDDIPGFHTYTVSLSKYHRCSERCIQRQKNRLKELNIIVDEKRLGKNGLEIRFNPIIFETQSWSKRGAGTTVHLKSPSQGSSGTFSISQYDNLSPINKRTFKTKTNNVDKFISQVTQKYGVAPQQGIGQKAPMSQERLQEPLEDGSSGSFRQGLNVPDSASKPLKRDASRREGQPIFLVEKFWNFAKKILYPGRKSTVLEDAEIIANIQTSVFGNFEKHYSAEQWDDLYIESIKRVHKAAKWFKLHPDFQIQNPLLYFSPDNNKIGSFEKTLDWIADDNRKVIISQIKFEIREYNKGKGIYHTKTIRQLFRIHEKRVANIGDSKLLKQFYSMAQGLYSET